MLVIKGGIHSLLILNETDTLQAVSMHDVIHAIEEAYLLYEQNDFNMPLRSQIRDRVEYIITYALYGKRF